LVWLCTKIPLRSVQHGKNESLENLLILQVHQPAVCGEDGFIEFAVRQVEPRRALGVEVGQRLRGEFLGVVGWQRDPRPASN
jgi:hypothetical protein